MTTNAALMREQAARVYARAIRARESGEIALAEMLAASASQWLDRAIEAEAAAAGTPPPSPEQQQPVAQQQQQVQPEKDEPEK